MDSKYRVRRRLVASSLGYSLAFTPVSVGRLRFFIHGHSGTLSGIKVAFYEIPVAGTQWLGHTCCSNAKW
jgi:hypothetical protein